MLAGYAAVVGHYGADLPLQDYPNHLARAVVMADLLWNRGADFSGLFTVHLLAVPYLAGDLLLAALVHAFGIATATALWNAFIVASMPAAVYVYLRSIEVSPPRIVLAVILSLYLATDWFFLKGFLAFRLAVPTLLVTLALARPLRVRWTPGRYALYLAVLAAGYLVHLTVTIFEAAALGAVGLFALRAGRSSWRREFALLAPVGVLLIWQFAVAGGYRQPQDAVSDYYFWGTWAGKLHGMDAQFLRFSRATDLWLLLGTVACVAWPLRRGVTLRQFADPEVLESLVLAATFVVLYLVLPVGYADAWYVDARAMELAVLFLLFACLRLACLRPGPGEAASYPFDAAPAIAVATLLAIGNLYYLDRHFAKDAAWIAHYRELLTGIPRGAWVLPVYQQPREGTLRPLLHVGSFAVTDAKAMTPYLFSADGGYPMSYFRYVAHRYSPDEAWYGTHGDVDWRRVACEYQYLLMMAPFDRSRIGVPYVAVAGNESGVLLRIDPQACPRDLPNILRKR